MKFTINSSDLLKKLQFASAIISPSPSLPILSNFLLEFQAGNIVIVASDLETTITANLPADCKAGPKIAVPAKLLVETLKSFPSQPITIEVNKATIDIVTGDSVGRYSTGFEPGDTFPTPKQSADGLPFTLPCDVLATAISKTTFAAGTDSLRPQLCGVYVDRKKTGTNFVATDTHKLTLYERADLGTDEPSSAIIPKKPLNALKAMLPGFDDVMVLIGAQNVGFQLGDGEYVVECRLIDGKFPNYSAVIPKENDKILTIDRAKFLSSLKCVAIFANKTTNQVRLDFKGNTLKISAEDVDYSNRASEELTCKYEGEDLTIGFNAKLLIEMLSNLQTESVKIEMSQPNRAGILCPEIENDEHELTTMLLMPVLLGK